MQRRTVLCCCLLATVLGTTAHVSAEAPIPRPLTLISSASGAKRSGQAALLNRLIQEALTSRGAQRKQYSPLFDPTELTTAVETLESARKALAKDHNLARASDHALQFNRALLAFKGALAHATVGDLVEAHTAMALTHLKSDNRRLAADYLATAMLMKPSLTERDFLGQPIAKELFRELRAGFSARSKGSIQVSSKRKGVEVYRNDTLVGYTPLTLDDVPEGTHLIRLKRDGFYGDGKFVTVRGGEKAALNVHLKPVPGRSAVDRALRVLRKTRWPKSGKGIEPAVADIIRVLKTKDLVILDIRRRKKDFLLTGAVALNGGPPRQIKQVIAADSKLLSSVSALVESWYAEPTSAITTQETAVEGKTKAPDKKTPATAASPSNSRSEIPDIDPETPDIEPETPDVEPEE